ncbi:MAG: carboxypeptidase-like regulatory domain-containing protein [Planctomycetota bacterium]
MRSTIGAALGVCALTGMFLAIVVEKRPVHRTVPQVEPVHATAPKAVAPREKGVVELRLMQGTLLFTHKARFEGVLAADAAVTCAQETAGGVVTFRNLTPGAWYFSASTPTHAAPVRIAIAGDKPARVDLPIDPAGKIRGTVFDAAGKPLREASIVARELIEAHGSGAPREAVADADGRFEFAFLAAGRFELVAASEGWEPSRSEVEVKAGKPTETEGTIFRLAPVKWGRIRGRVVDADGKPVDGASLRVLAGESRVVKEPGADGEFDVEVPPGRVVLAADAPGFAMVVREDVVVAKGGEESVEIRLGTGSGVVEGRILLGTGEPAAGALVECVQGSGEPGEASTSVIASTRTDAEGGFLVRGFADGVELKLRVVAEGQPSIETSVLRAPSTGCEVVVGDVRYALLGGHVVAADPSPPYELKLWRVSATGGRSLVGVYTPGTESSARDPQFKAGEGGEFTFERVMPGTYALAVSAPGYASTEVGAIVVPADALLTGVSLRLGKGRSISGRVVGKGSQAKLKGVKVTVQNAAKETVATTETDAEGNFTASNIGPGHYTLLFHHEEYREAHDEVDVTSDRGAEGLRVPMDDSPALVGKVFDAEGKPAAGGLVVAMRDGERREAEIHDGAYEIRGLSGGVYLLQASSPGSGQARKSGVNVAADGRSSCDLRLSQGGTVRITVKAGEAAVVGAKVSLRWKDGTEVGVLSLLDGAGEPAEGTDAHGVLVLLNVPAEPLILRVTRGGTSREIPVSVLEGSTLAIPVGWTE